MLVPSLHRECVDSLINDHIYYTHHTFTSEAVVGLERTFYSVSEDVGVVEVCAIVYSPTIDCPIAFPFNVSLSTSEGSAGKCCDEYYFITYLW